MLFISKRNWMWNQIAEEIANAFHWVVIALVEIISIDQFFSFPGNEIMTERAKCAVNSEVNGIHSFQMINHQAFFECECVNVYYKKGCSPLHCCRNIKISILCLCLILWRILLTNNVLFFFPFLSVNSTRLLCLRSFIHETRSKNESLRIII